MFWGGFPPFLLPTGGTTRVFYYGWLWKGAVTELGVSKLPQKTKAYLGTLPPTNIALVGGYPEDDFPLGGTLCQLPC